MRIVIIGATGNIGTAVLRRLREGEAAHELVGIARRRPDERAGPYRGVEWHLVDVSVPGAVPELASILDGADAVLHLAWLLQPNHRERELWATNVDGLRRALEAAVIARVPHVVVASSVGAYSRGPKHSRVGEEWPTGGVHTSHYSRHKAVDERILDAFEAANPDVVLTRVRPGLVFQRDAASEMARLFVGGLLPVGWLGRVRVPVLPVPVQVISQAVHADDLADAIVRIIERRAGGAFNVAGEPVLDPVALAEVVGARRVVPVRLAARARAHVAELEAAPAELRPRAGSTSPRTCRSCPPTAPAPSSTGRRVDARPTRCGRCSTASPTAPGWSPRRRSRREHRRTSPGRRAQRVDVAARRWRMSPGSARLARCC